MTTTTIFIACLFIMSVRSHVDRLQYGVVFSQENTLDVSQEYWLHSQEIIMDLHDDELPQSDCLNRNDINYCDYVTPIQNYVSKIYNSVIKASKSDLMNVIRMIPTKSQRSSGRSTRSLFPFVGSINKVLYNEATMDDVNKVLLKMSSINRETIDHTDDVIRVWTDNLSSWSRQYDDRLNSLSTTMNKTVQSLAAMYDQFSEEEANLQMMFSSGARSLMDTAIASSFIHTAYSDLQTAIIAAMNGHLSPHLINPKELARILDDTKITISASFPEFHLTYNDLDYYYRDNCIFVTRTSRSIWVTIKLPLTSVDNMFNLYKIHSMNVPVHNETSLSSKINNVPNYIALNLNSQTFIEIKEKPEDCIKNNHICRAPSAYLDFNSESCALAIFLNEQNSIKEHCQFQINNEKLTSQVLEIDPERGAYLLINISKIHKATDNKLSVRDGCMFCIYSLPCDTSVLFDNFIINKRIVNCNNEDHADTSIYPQNLALALHLTKNISDMNIYSSFERSTLLEDKLKDLNKSMIVTLSKFVNNSIDLKEISKILELNNSEFKKHINNEILDFGQSLNTPSFHLPSLHWSEISNIALIIFDIAHLALTIYLFRKISFITTMVGIIGLTRAQDTPTIKHITYHHHEIHSYLFYVTCCMTFINIIAISMWMFHFIVKRRSGGTLGIDFATDETHCSIFIKRLPRTPITNIRLNFQGRICADAISCGLKPKLWLDNLRVRVFILMDGNGKYIPIETIVKISWLQYFKLRKILRQPFTAHFVVRNQGTISYIRPCPPTCAHATCTPWFPI